MDTTVTVFTDHDFTAAAADSTGAGIASTEAVVVNTLADAALDEDSAEVVSAADMSAEVSAAVDAGNCRTLLDSNKERLAALTASRFSFGAIIEANRGKHTASGSGVRTLACGRSCAR
jgi:hypothetical protein